MSLFSGNVTLLINIHIERVPTTLRYKQAKHVDGLQSDSWIFGLLGLF